MKTQFYLTKSIFGVNRTAGSQVMNLRKFKSFKQTGSTCNNVVMDNADVQIENPNLIVSNENQIKEK